MRLTRKREIVVGSGNVFRDLRLKDPEELLARATLAAWIVQILEERRVSQTQAAKLLGVDQPKLSLIYRGRLDDFSVERLMRFLTALHRDIRIVVGEKPRRGRGRVIVEAALTSDDRTANGSSASVTARSSAMRFCGLRRKVNSASRG
jgi:predicted XRE-type DNA-binding protein